MHKKAKAGATARLKHAKSECRCGVRLTYAKSVLRTFKTFEKTQRPPKRHPKDHFNAYRHRDVGMRFSLFLPYANDACQTVHDPYQESSKKQNHKSQRHQKQKEDNIFIKNEKCKNE